MRVDAIYVKQARQDRGWTQQHLADACEVNLRTIQRVEKDAAASPDTVHALCAVLELDRTKLLYMPRPEDVGMKQSHPLRQMFVPALTGLGGVILGVLGTMLFLN